MTTFTAHDRCDVCGAQAQGRARKIDSVLELLFCGHHSHKFATALASKGWSVEYRTADIVVSDALATT